MRVLDLKSGHRVLLDEADYAALGCPTVYVGTNGYAYVTRWTDGASRPNTLHAEIVGVQPGYHIDHINGDKLDNRRSNLRHVSYTLNQVNRKHRNRNNSSGHRGVVRRVQKSGAVVWIAQLTIHHQNVYIGSFGTIDEAVEARRQAELRYFGEVCP